MLISAGFLLRATLAADEFLGGADALRWQWLYSGNGEDARNLLSTLATAVITISSLVLSLTIVALSLAANQFGSRLVRTYMRDPRTKACIGLFLLTIGFCLLALRAVSGDMKPEQVPQVTVSSGLFLGIACVMVLIFYLHMVARSIVADEVIRKVAQELHQVIGVLPDAGADEEQAPEDHELLPSDNPDRRLLLSSGEGYVQEIHYERIAARADQAGVVVRLEVRAGDYMCLDGWLGWAAPAALCSDQVMDAMRAGIVLGPERTPVQDVEFPIRHLVDVALRALSPGINDANTALAVVDRLRGALSLLLRKRLPSHAFRSPRGDWVLIGRPRDHAMVIAQAFRPIHDAAARQPWVVVSVLEAYAKLAEHARTPGHVQALRTQARLLLEQAGLQPLPPDEDRRMQAARAALEDKLALVAGSVRLPAGPDEDSQGGRTGVGQATASSGTSPSPDRIETAGAR